MKLAIYGVRADERGVFVRYAEKYGHMITLISDFMNERNLDSALSCDGIITSDTPCTRPMIQKMASMGIRYLSTRTAGYGSFDLEALRDFNIKFARVPSYSPNSVAEFEVLSTLALIRNYKEMHRRTDKNDLSIIGLQGLEIRNLTLGFIGMGRIGRTAAECFRGFHPAKMLAYDVYPDASLKDIYWLTLEEVLKNSDIVLLNTPLTPENHYLIGKKTIPLMKPGSFLVNAARGALVDTSAVLDALDQNTLAGYAADVYENETGLVYTNLSGQGISDPLFNRLNRNPKVVYTPHTAFYTDEAVSNMVETSLANMKEFEENGANGNEVKEPA